MAHSFIDFVFLLVGEAFGLLGGWVVRGLGFGEDVGVGGAGGGGAVRWGLAARAVGAWGRRGLPGGVVEAEHASGVLWWRWGRREADARDGEVAKEVTWEDSWVIEM